MAGSRPSDLDDGERLRGEGFVELDEVDLVEGEAGEFERFGDGVDGADAHLFGVAAGVGEGDEAGERLECRAARRGAADMTTAAAAPSEVCEELPAVTVPFAWKTGLSLARASSEVSARGPSSLSKIASVVDFGLEPVPLGGDVLVTVDGHDFVVELAGGDGGKRFLVAAIGELRRPASREMP